MNDLCYFIGEGSVYALCIEAFSRPPNVGSAIKLGASHGVLGAVARNYWPEIIYVETPQAVRKRVMGVAKGKTPPEDEVHAWLLARYPELDALMGGGRRHMLDAAAVVVAALNEGRLS
jgi:Holliday junction resolvasome RuvABC endonuclease subunit